MVPGKLTAAQIARMVKAGHGHAELKTVEGDSLTATTEGKRVFVTDAKGLKALVTIANVTQSNGEIHVIDHVLLPD